MRQWAHTMWAHRAVLDAFAAAGLPVGGETPREQLDAEAHAMGFHGYEDCPNLPECPTAYRCSERGNCDALVLGGGTETTDGEEERWLTEQN
jgi:hypothetical protein